MFVDFDTIEAEEEIRQAEAAEEIRRYKEARLLEKTVELEGEAVRRLEHENETMQRWPLEGRNCGRIRGNLIIVGKRPKSKSRDADPGKFFLDVLNQAQTSLQRMCNERSKVGCSEMGDRWWGSSQQVALQHLEDRIDMIWAMFDSLMAPFMFELNVQAHCEIVSETLQGDKGLPALVQQFLASDPPTKKPKLALEGALQAVIARARRILCGICCEEEPWQSIRGVYAEVMRVVFPNTPAPLVGSWVEMGGDIKQEEELELYLRLPESGEERMVILARGASVHDFRSTVAGLLGFDHEVELVGLQKNGSISSTQLKDEAKLRAVVEWCSHTFLVNGVSHWPPSSEPRAPFNSDGEHGDCDGGEDLHTHERSEWMLTWRALVGKARKTTPESAACLLYRLRTQFTEAAFVQKYHELKAQSSPGNAAHTELLARTFNIQAPVLKMYGYEATPKGLQEMRNEMMIFAGMDVWDYHPPAAYADEVVWKIRRDIHSVLDMGQPLPRMRLNGGFVSWMLWASLQAGVLSACERAAKAVAGADVLLLCTGAGFSADSGLAVYDDVAKVSAYASRQLEYSDLCKPDLLRREPELFWGFWGQCYNDYRETAPHEGYSIISRWVARRFRDSDVAKDLRQRVQKAAERNALPTAAPGKCSGSAKSSGGTSFALRQTYDVEDHAGAFFVFTSNVDAHNFDWFQACEIRECHGNVETYQCAAQSGRCDPVWRAPLNFKYYVDKDTMLAEKGDGIWYDLADGGGSRSTGAARSRTAAEVSTTGAAPRIGQVRGGGRPTALRHMPSSPTDLQQATNQSFEQNWPKCPFCSGPARPAICMFKDKDFRDVRPQAQRWEAWGSAVQDLARERSAGDDAPLRVVLLEFGAGSRVTTVRENSEAQLAALIDAGAEVLLVRINPELPLGDSARFGPGGDDESVVISIMSRSLDSIQNMEAAMPPEMRSEGSP